MIGQKRLQLQIGSYDYQTLPQSLLLEGESGCGKHTLLKELSQRFNVPVVDITKNLKYEYLSALFTQALPTIYLVEGNALSNKESNALLKFLEEPPANAKIAVLCAHKQALLETIQNRCFLLSFDKYTKEELLNFTSDENILKYASTPGQILELSKNDLTSVLNFCKLIIDNIGSASIPNTLSITNKFAEDNEEGYDITIFFRILLNEFVSRAINAKEKKYIDAYFLTSKFCAELNLGSNKKKLLEMYLLNLKKTLR